jgi:hypothetical protein
LKFCFLFFNCFLTLSGKQRVRMFEKRVVKKVLVCMKEEIT